MRVSRSRPLRRVFSCLAVALLAAATVAPALAQGLPCGRRDDLVRHLSERWHEAPVGRGIAGAVVLEIWRSADGSSWTIFVTRPDGFACVTAAGEVWQEIEWATPEGERS